MNNINWQQFLDNCDLKFDDVKYKGGFYREDEYVHMCSKSFAREWDDGVFIGNGMIGAMIYKKSEDTIMWELGRNDVVAHNYLSGIDWATPRVPIGSLMLTNNAPVEKESMAINLYDAKTTGFVKTTKGTISWTTTSLRQDDVIIVDVTTTGDEKNAFFSYEAKHGISDRIYFSGKKAELRQLPPLPFTTTIDGVTTVVQTFVKEENDVYSKEGECAVAYKEVVIDENHRVVYLAIKNSVLDNTARFDAVNSVKKAMATAMEELLKEHTNWWHNYYAQSYLTLNDKKWEAFYWQQIYKVACATRPDGVVIDSQGPWLTYTPWPTTVWNLNVELSYSPLFTSNRADLALSLIKVLKENRQILIDNAKPMGIDDGMFVSRATTPLNLSDKWPGTHEMGNLMWALFIVYRYYRVTNDITIVNDLLFPYLKMACNSCFTLFETDENGKYHLTATASPEYPVVKGTNAYPITDCNYTLALLRWSLDTLVAFDDEFGMNDPLKAKWIDVLANLADYPVDENGYMIGKDVPYATSHRHYSHLMMIYPICNSDMNDPAQKALAEKSVAHWTSLMEYLQGYTYTGAASMMAIMKNGNKALEYLNGLDDFLCPNTMYSEKGPVVETPISGAETIHTMLLQSNNGVVNIFPAVADSWSDVEFRNFLGEGGFEVSASRKDGKTKEVTIKNLFGNKLVVDFNTADKFSVTSGNGDKVVAVDDKFEISIAKGEEISFAF